MDTINQKRWNDQPGRTTQSNKLTRWSCYGFSGFALFFFLLLVAIFIYQSVPVWKHEGWGYVTGTIWFFRIEKFGILPMIYGTIMVSVVALIIAAPIAIIAAIFTSEYLNRKWRMWFKIVVELLAGVPSVVYGLLGILFLRNWVYEGFEDFDLLSGDTLLTASVLLGVMILPTIMTLCDDAFRGVGGFQRQAARSLGITKSETIWKIVIPQAKPGMVAAVLLALGRALGETIAVFLVVGRQDNQWPESLMSFRPLLESGQTLTSKLGGAEVNIAYGDPLHWAAVTGLALILLMLVAICNVCVNFIYLPNKQ